MEEDKKPLPAKAKVGTVSEDNLDTALSEAMAATGEDKNAASENFNAILGDYDAYLHSRENLLKKQKVQVAQIVGDKEAQESALLTFDAINRKVRQNIADGVDISPNDIKLLVEMLKALNGE